MVAVGDIYTYKGNNYYIVNLGKMKHPTNRKWVDCVIYKLHSSSSLIDRSLHCREIEDFITKFRKIN